MIRQRFGDKLGAIDAGVRKEGGYYLFTLRLVPAFPFFVINLVMGFSGQIDNMGHIGGLLGGTMFAWFAGPKMGIKDDVYPPTVGDTVLFSGESSYTPARRSRTPRARTRCRGKGRRP